VWPDVRNVRLQTLAEYFRCATKPCHRALPDAEACAEVLHGLLELGGRLGILTLGDLHQSVRARGRPHYAKIRLADALPGAPGIYLFRGRDGRVLYVGKSTDLRARVKSYFYGDDRKKVNDLLAETISVEGRPTPSELEALVLEARHIRVHQPTYNRRGKLWRRAVYLRIDPAEPYPRIVVSRSPNRKGVDRARVLGPFPSRSSARLAQEALEEIFPIRRCTRPMRATTRFSSCALAGMGRCLAPCNGRSDPERYGELVRALISSLEAPDGLLEALGARLDRLVGMERFEEAGLLRDRIRALAEALSRERSDRWLGGSGRLTLRDTAGRTFRFVAGALEVPGEPAPDPPGLPPRPDLAAEVAAVRGWLSRNPVTVVDAERPLSEPVVGGARLHRLLGRLRSADQLGH
jgi:DNA polymerase III subunit epsilon